MRGCRLSPGSPDEARFVYPFFAPENRGAEAFPAIARHPAGVRRLLCRKNLRGSHGE